MLIFSRVCAYNIGLFFVVTGFQRLCPRSMVLFNTMEGKLFFVFSRVVTFYKTFSFISDFGDIRDVTTTILDCKEKYVIPSATLIS